MDDVSAGEIKDAPPRQVALSPVPMGNWAVDPAVPDEEEDEHRRELHALSKRPRGDDSAAQAKQGIRRGVGFQVEGKQTTSKARSQRQTGMARI